jgi:hypothetical protein
MMHYYPIYSATRANSIVFETIDDENTLWKCGDIVKFYAAYYKDINMDEWKKWFLTLEDIEKEEKKCTKIIKISHSKIPLYAHKQYGIILKRYRKTKKAWTASFRDYGSEIMMISGNRVGHIKRVYAYTPFKIISTFPYNNIPKRPNNILSKFNALELALNLNSKYGTCYNARKKFVEEFQKRINEACL